MGITMKLPTQVDLRPQINQVEDQGSYGTCNPFAKCKTLQILYERDGKKLDFSELYLYYYARLLQNSWGPDWADGGFFGLTYKNFMDANCTSLVDCITGFNGKLHPAPYFDPKEILDLYDKVWRKDVTSVDDEGVQWWAHDPDGKRNFLTTWRDMCVKRCDELLETV